MTPLQTQENTMQIDLSKKELQMVINGITMFSRSMERRAAAETDADSKNLWITKQASAAALGTKLAQLELSFTEAPVTPKK